MAALLTVAVKVQPGKSETYTIKLFYLGVSVQF